MKSLLLAANFLFVFLLTGKAQDDQLIIQPNINLPKDSLIKKELLSSLNTFLSYKDNPASSNPYVWKEHSIETGVLLDEMKGVEKSTKYKDDKFYKGYLTNACPVTDSSYLIQLSYIGQNENKSLTRASFRILAKRIGDHFYFASPLQQNTGSWKSKKIGNCTFHFRTTINTAKAAAYQKLVAYFDSKLNVAGQQMDFYCCYNFPEVLSLVGVDYKSDYNGYGANSLSFSDANRTVSVNGVVKGDFNNADSHDLWHSRLHRVVSTEVINRPVDEGCAYLYGGSWGLSWAAIVKMFKERVSSNPDSDWLSLYSDMKNFGDSEEKRLYIAYVINALLVQKIEKEKGFPAVLELLKCGKYDKANDNYFAALEKITGITKATFNTEIWKLVKAI